MINVVTSCSAEGWKQYGKRFVETFLRHWPTEISLYLVSEDSIDVDAKRVNFVPLWNSKEARRFEARHRENKRAHGRERHEKDAGWTPKKIADGYNFRYDAYRFAKKVFAINLVAARVAEDRLFWVDADVLTFADVPIEALGRLMPNGYALSCLDRGHYHSECGFVGYNLDNPAARAFIVEFARLYASDEVFELQEWHDSWVFDWLRQRRIMATHQIPHMSRSHPMANAEIISTFLDHTKGNRKALGRTPKHERVMKDDVAYWR